MANERSTTLSTPGRTASEGPKTITVPWVTHAPERGEKLVMVTAYDFPQARAADASGVDIVLVGDSLAMVVLGHSDTLSVTMDGVDAARYSMALAVLLLTSAPLVVAVLW